MNHYRMIDALNSKELAIPKCLSESLLAIRSLTVTGFHSGDQESNIHLRVRT